MKESIPGEEGQAGTRQQRASDLPFDNPAGRLTPGALRILEASKRVLLRDGLGGLTWDAIAAESGRNKSMIKYHFGDTEGLLRAIYLSLEFEGVLAFTERVNGTMGRDRLRHYVAGQQDLASDADSYRVFFELLPYILRHKEMKESLVAATAYYYQQNLEWLGLADRVRPENRDAFVALAALLTATCDGLAIQALERPPGFDIGKTYSVLESLLAHGIDGLLDELESKDNGPGGAGRENQENSSRKPE